ncbi:hypothetical protein IW262DRAFT_774763 [Armillaria fumosa]|nr:hypothetical protein IW262DRAFT_774763 [Armillaria fumosa]
MHSTHCAVYLSFLCIAIWQCYVLDLINNRSSDIYPGAYTLPSWSRHRKYASSSATQSLGCSRRHGVALDSCL